MVVDCDMDVFPADRAAATALVVCSARPVRARCASADAFTGSALDPAELLDVDVHELAWS